MNTLSMLWSNYLINVVDILAVAYVFYRLMLVIQGTRAVQVILGILTLVVITFVSRNILGLQTLTWIFEKFWDAAIIIVAVVFQPEIRSALAQLGSHRWGRILLKAELSFIEEIIESLKEFSEKHTGALIVIEQDTGLKNYIETGTVINGQVSRELLGSIFNFRSPLHDGAVIIQNARIIAAGCVLPLSHEPGLSKILGTRHRAAMGLSEISDAIIMVVSEETGKISVAREGKLTNGVQPDDVRALLTELYREQVAKIG